MKCISLLRSVGIAAPLLVLNLCFPGDLWWLQGVGRSRCDYCLHPDLYLSFNYLRVSAGYWCQYIPSFGTSKRKRESSTVSTSPVLTPSVVPGPKRGSSAPLAASQSSMGAELTDGAAFLHGVGAEIWTWNRLFPLSLCGQETHRNHIPRLAFSTLSFLSNALYWKNHTWQASFQQQAAVFPFPSRVGGIWKLH